MSMEARLERLGLSHLANDPVALEAALQEIQSRLRAKLEGNPSGNSGTEDDEEDDPKLGALRVARWRHQNASLLNPQHGRPQSSKDDAEVPAHQDPPAD